MMFNHLPYALLAPTLAQAAAFAWSLPSPTLFHVEADTWSPAPTAAPKVSVPQLLKRSDPDNTCGFISGSSESSITCPNPTAICATNTYYAAHGCCDPSFLLLSSCTIPTTCIPATALSTACTDTSCSNGLTTRCTDVASPACYQLLLIYDATATMTQHGCASEAYTKTAWRRWGAVLSSVTAGERVTVTAPAVVSPTSPSSATGAAAGKASVSLGVIVGSTIGACVFLSFVAFTAFLVWRKRSALRDAKGPGISTSNGMSGFEFSGFGSPAMYAEAGDGGKAWQDGGKRGDGDGGLRYPGVRWGVVEVDGRERAVEAPG